WDQGNYGLDQLLPLFAGVNPDPNVGAVMLYAQAGTGPGLLLDTDRDGVCDEVDTTVGFKQMFVVNNAGAADYRTGASIDPDPPLLPKGCTGGGDTANPEKLCNKRSDLTRVIQHEQVGGTPENVIYGLLPSGGECDANETQLKNILAPDDKKNGWVCLA